MAPRTKVLVGVAVLLAWLSQTIYLYPLPGESVQNFVESQGRAFDRGTAPTGGESKEVYLARIQKLAVEDFWPPWIYSLLATILGLVAAIALIKQWRSSLPLLLVSSLVYVAMWVAFNGVLTSQLSVVALLRDMWSMAENSHTQVMYLHKNVFLLVGHVVLIVVAGIALGRNARDKRRALSSR